MTLVWRPGFQFDADASTYIEAVEAADTQALETGVRYAINDFVIGCKQDGIWSAIKASCILAGARTLSGALQPLAGTAPTNVGGLFVQADYNRKTGLVGNGSTKYLDSNRANNADPQNNAHCSIYATTVTANSAALPVYLGAYEASTGMRQIRAGSSAGTLSTRCMTASLVTQGSNAAGFLAINRSNSTDYTVRSGGANVISSTSSANPTASRLCVFAQYQNVNSTPGEYSSGRLSFYSIGEALDLAKLDARVTALINAFGAAIP